MLYVLELCYLVFVFVANFRFFALIFFVIQSAPYNYFLSIRAFRNAFEQMNLIFLRNIFQFFSFSANFRFGKMSSAYFKRQLSHNFIANWNRFANSDLWSCTTYNCTEGSRDIINKQVGSEFQFYAKIRHYLFYSKNRSINYNSLNILFSGSSLKNFRKLKIGITNMSTYKELITIKII